MNRQQRRKALSKKGGMYRGLKRPTEMGWLMEVVRDMDNSL